MGKGAKKGKFSFSSSSSSSATPKCTCDHPYTCTCTNRPPRPSRGHKWDPATQTWGGKGHKQKGASGQTASASASSVTTSIGRTTVAQWQKLPSTLLREVCRKEGRPPPKFKSLSTRGGPFYKYRVIIQDAKESKRGGEHDVMLVPSNNKVENEEQAKEEAALLGLLTLTPALPHERKLPEPYRTTWMNAVASKKQEKTKSDGGGARKIKKKGSGSNVSEDSSDSNKPPTAAASSSGTAAAAAAKKGRGTAAATASSNLLNANAYTTLSQKRQQHQQARQTKLAKIRKHEAVRLANKPHSVFLSASTRKKVETLLREGVSEEVLRALAAEEVHEEEEKEKESEEEEEDEEDEVKLYVYERLHSEGFTRRQITTAFDQLKKNSKGRKDVDVEMDRAYENCLQWLCVHLNEEALPEGFDPRGRTLEVVKRVNNNNGNNSSGGGGGGGNNKKNIKGGEKKKKEEKEEKEKEVVLLTKEVKHLVKTYGITVEEATVLHNAASKKNTADATAENNNNKNNNNYKRNIEKLLWDAIISKVSHETKTTITQTESEQQQQQQQYQSPEENKEITSEEMEALEAIFPPEDLQIQQTTTLPNKNETCISIQMSSDPNNNYFVSDDDDDTTKKNMTLVITIQKDLYPSQIPSSVFLIAQDYTTAFSTTTNTTQNKQGVGSALHVNLVSFMNTSLVLGEPMIYELYNHAQSLLTSLHEEEEEGGGESEFLVPKIKDGLDSVLLPFMEGGMEFVQEQKEKKKKKKKKETDQTQQQQQQQKQESNDINNNKKRKQKNNSLTSSTIPKQQQQQQRQRRPRERSSFWNTHPTSAPPATPFPSTVTQQISKARSKLPASKAKTEFLSLLKNNNNRVILITGETGCGKTTQIPQFILEEYPSESKIVVAQPRRLAATGVAARVAEERGESKPGTNTVGYVVRGDTAMSPSSRLLFCTTGVLLRQLQNENALDCISHIVVDEVHERHLDTDVLLGVLKESLDAFEHLRVILMSATMDADRFAAYWGEGTPRMHIPGFTYPVEDYTLEDVLELTGYVPPKNGKKKKKKQFGGAYGGGRKKQSPWADSERSDDDEDDEDEKQSLDTTTSASSSRITNPQSSSSIPVEELVKRVNESNIDYDLLGTLIRHILQKKSRDDDGSILVFLPGAPEISKAEQTLRRILGGSAGIFLLPLHGGLQPKDQQLVFRKAPRGKTKVILSTNVAETSITIPDCTVVVDTCREKQSSYDPSNRMPLLIERFASRDSLKQRRGRAGRVRPGTCYKLISSGTHGKLPEHGEPEIRRCALDQTLLGLMFLGVESGEGDFLGKLLDAPSRESVEAAIYSLEKLGAVVRDGGAGGGGKGRGLRLTPLGMHLAGIPAPPSVGKILIMGSLLGCRSAALAMAAGMSVGKSPFLKIDTFRFNGKKDDDDTTESAEEVRQKKILEERKALFKSVGNSDHAMLAAVYMTWNNLSAGGGERRRYCESMGLSFNGMRDMKQLVTQLDSSLRSSGYFSSEQSNANSNSWRIIRACAVSALAPGQIVRVERPSAKYSETAEGAVEKGGKAKELKFFIRGSENNPSNDKKESNGSTPSSNTIRRYHGVAEERVFIHPSSANFTVGSYPCPWLVYHQLVRTSKAFLRDATECSSYALLLFGGKVEVQASNELLIIDDWVRLSANARIGALIGGLRTKVEDLLSKKVADPNLDIAGTAQMKIIVNLLKTDGLGE